MMRSNKYFLLIFMLFFTKNVFSAEIIENKKIIDKTFGNWQVSCEDDVMLSTIRCKLFAEIMPDTFLFVTPDNLFDNQILVVSGNILYNTRMMLKVDYNKLVQSKNYNSNQYKILIFDIKDKNRIFDEMVKGEFLYIRFSVANDDKSAISDKKEVTVRLTLTELGSAIKFYLDSITKYNKNYK